ncbi:S8 family serine peptidase [Aliikangiella coralliicola]|uniref:S8 family serine peptidase n=2 Tax=Aliikangiella coralliicola TaxID=2592383 RepID=A0A545U977_9GAMM|nr:S8 family serine peptidase [Aliikangiella coralliicola]
MTAQVPYQNAANQNTLNHYAVPRRFLVTLKLGEMPEKIPSMVACRHFGVHPANRLDGGPFDRILRHHGGSTRICRLHNSRTKAAQRPGVIGARRFDEAEQLSGVARVLLIQTQNDVHARQLMEAVAQIPIVEKVQADRICIAPFYSEPVFERTPETDASNSITETDEAQAWQSRLLTQLPQALGFEPGDPSVVVGLADTGIMANHRALTANIRRGFDTVDLKPSMVGDLQLVGDNRSFDELPFDEVGHGTGCAGILQASGGLLPPGGAGRCGLTPVRVLGAGLSAQKRIGIGALSNIDAGMKRLIDLNVKVVNMSFGTAKSSLSQFSPLPHEEVVKYALSRDVILVAASGNSGIEEAYYPAAHEGVIAVGAVDNHANPCAFSTRGNHVDLCAPGKKVWTTGMNGYQQVTGTSFAAPFVAGVCALMAAHAARRALPLNASIAADILRQSARPFASANVEGYGSGVVDALAALQLLSQTLDSHHYLDGQNSMLDQSNLEMTG